jgi:hypothetical protein
VAGYTDSTNFPGTAGGAQTSSGGFTDAFVTRFNAALTSRLQSTYLGGSSTDRAYALAVHPVSGEVLVAGYTDSTNFPGTAGGAQAGLSGGADAFVTRFNAALTSRLQSTYLGGSGFDHAYALAVHPVSGEVLVAGETGSTNFPGTGGGAQPALGGGYDAFVSRLTPRLEALALCDLDMDGDGQVTATKEMLVMTRATLGLPPAQAVLGTGITQAQWDAKRAQLAACGIVF